jgi:ATP-dependent Lhr-like helicase
LEEAWPRVRDEDELFDVLQVMVWMPKKDGESWRDELDGLVAKGRALVLRITSEESSNNNCIEGWITRDHFARVQTLFPQVEILAGEQDTRGRHDEEERHSSESVALYLVQGWMPYIGPVTVKALAGRLGVAISQVHQALLQLEGQGQVLRGHFRPSSLEEEWCDRSLLARIHQRIVRALRREIEPVAASDFMRFLFRWQHCASGAQLHGEAGLREIIAQLAGYETSASAWESFLFRGRVANYKPEWLDNLCLRGEVAWGRLTPPDMKPNLRSVVEGESFRRITPTSMAPISFVRRDDIAWMLAMARPGKASGPLSIRLSLSAVAQAIYECLDCRGACFFPDLTTRTRHLAAEVEQALWELVATGLVTADGFDPLRALLDPRRRRAEGKFGARRPRHSAGRWALLEAHAEDPEADTKSSIHPHERWAKQLARRYGIIFRDLLKRESLPVTWRELLLQYRKMEWRGEMRGGRFVDGFTGEQFALPEAVEALRAVRRDPQAGAQDIRLSPADPLNLVGIILPGERISSHTSKTILFRDGVQVFDHIPVMSLA